MRNEGPLSEVRGKRYMSVSPESSHSSGTWQTRSVSVGSVGWASGGPMVAYPFAVQQHGQAVFDLALVANDPCQGTAHVALAGILHPLVAALPIAE